MVSLPPMPFLQILETLAHYLTDAIFLSFSFNSQSSSSSSQFRGTLYASFVFEKSSTYLRRQVLFKLFIASVNQFWMPLHSLTVARMASSVRLALADALRTFFALFDSSSITRDSYQFSMESSDACVSSSASLRGSQSDPISLQICFGEQLLFMQGFSGEYSSGCYSVMFRLSLKKARVWYDRLPRKLSLTQSIFCLVSDFAQYSELIL